MTTNRAQQVDHLQTGPTVSGQVDVNLAVIQRAAETIAKGASVAGAPAKDTRYRILGARAGALGAIATTAACVAAAAPALIAAMPSLFGPVAVQAMAKVDLMTTLNASTSAALLGLITFSLMPEIEKARAQVADLMEKQAQDNQTQKEGLDQLVILAETILRQNASLHRALEESSARAPAHRPPVRNSERVVRREAFGGASQGPVVTDSPHMIQEAATEATSDGGFRVYSLDDDIPESIARLQPDHPTTVWRVVLYLSHDRACLEMLSRFSFSLAHYAALAARHGRPLDLSKLELRILEAPQVGATTVFLPQVGANGEVHTTVLQYSFAEVVTGKGRIGVVVKGPVHKAAIERRDEALAKSHRIQAGALEAILKDCQPDASGRVSGETVRRWLDRPLPTIGELRTWRVNWLEDPARF